MIKSAPDPRGDAGLCQGVVVQRGIEKLGRNAAAGGAAYLCPFKVLSAPYTAAVVGDNFTQGDSHRRFNESDVVDMPQDAIDLGALAQRSFPRDLNHCAP